MRRVSLVRLCALIAQAASAIGKVSVEGEVHKVQRGRTGRLWFTLRDRASQISVSVPAARQARCRAVAGERACVVGRLEWVNDWGQLQLVADEVTPVGEGAIALAVAEARARLGADGLLARPRLAIPRLPATIGVICGHEAAVRADIESVIAARFPGYPVAFFETTVSGPGAVDNVVAALAELDGRTDVDVIILARGGGDATQLLPFSDEDLCRAVCDSSTPVVAAIGHDADRPLVDEVADLRCGTPSLAAAAVVPDLHALVTELDDLAATSTSVLAQRLAVAQSALAALDRAGAARSALGRGTEVLVRARGRLDLLHPARAWRDAVTQLARLDAGAPSRSHLAVAEARLAAAAGQADALSPVRVLERGYAVVRQAGGLVVRDAAAVAGGERLDIELAKGRLSAVAAAGAASAGAEGSPRG
ncbi:MAG TPA: exodeoxyribonuclease VII large subunit [Acidimicrobiia bacterium]|nr:exodeoxyribonuclease VII large subunit [Acidimicrobiia bacterium]